MIYYKKLLDIQENGNKDKHNFINDTDKNMDINANIKIR